MHANQQVQRALIGALVGGCATLGYGVAAFGAKVLAPEPVRLVKVSARRFQFVPDHITLKKGETIDVELVTEDVPMGFNAPDFAARRDIPPGQVSHVTLTAARVGTFTFFCDVFCGTGHEDMSGTITVTE